MTLFYSPYSLPRKENRNLNKGYVKGLKGTVNKTWRSYNKTSYLSELVSTSIR